MENIIEIQHLHKSFGEVHAVNDLSFRVKEGELFAFLGVNGAGKSTTIGMICGQLKKDAGEIWIDGKDAGREMDAIRESLGVVFQNSVLDKQLSVYDNLKSRAALYGIFGKEFGNRLEELDALLGLKELLKRALGKLSGGQRRRVDIARAILHRPKILILDEPTTGLDPQTRQTVWGVVDSLRKNENLTVFLTTHYMEEAADADYVVILDAGKIAAEGTPLDLKNTYTGDFITLYHVAEDEVARLGVPYEKLGMEQKKSGAKQDREGQEKSEAKQDRGRKEKSITGQGKSEQSEQWKIATEKMEKEQGKSEAKIGKSKQPEQEKTVADKVRTEQEKSRVEQEKAAPEKSKKSIYRIAVPDTAAATRLILAHPEVFSDYEIVKGKMDDVFLAVTGKKHEQEGEN